MLSRILVSGFFLATLLFPLTWVDARAAELPVSEDLEIGRMRVMIWPEYDDPGTLVVYDGRFIDDSKFPAIADFQIPKGAAINDICSLSPGGQHFCQLYDVTTGNDYDTVRLSLPFSNFYFSFHLAPVNLDIKERQIEYAIKTNHPVGSMEVDIQQPLRSTDFNILPSGGDRSVQKDFNHFNYFLKDIAKGDDRAFKINYIKNSRQPSVDVKYASMAGRRVWGSPYDTQRNVKTIVYAVFGTGLLMVMIAMFWIVKTRRQSGTA